MNTVILSQLRHFRCHLDSDGIAWLTLDCADMAVNRLSRDVLDELLSALDHFDRHPPAGLIILSGKASGFIAGADLKEFESLDDPLLIRALIQEGWEAFNRLATVPYPTLALIHGHCLGGGLELALACRYRLAIDQPDTSLGLPEVLLGIFPAWGGMRRLPALIGPSSAMDMMLSGKTIDGRKARRLGLIDALVPPRLRTQAASQHLRASLRPRRPSLLNTILNGRPLRPLALRSIRRTLTTRDPYQHYLAPRAIADIWAHHDGNALNAHQHLDDLARSPTARNLIRVFRLQERLKSFGKTGPEANRIRHVHVIGAGIMGGDIAAWCALKGLRVSLQDQDRNRIAVAQGRATTLFHRQLKSSRLEQAAADRLIPDPLGHGAAVADLIIEAITENLESKRTLFARIEPLMKDAAILATNTSSLSLTELGVALKDPARLVGIHFFNPVAKMPLVEVVETNVTAPSVRRTAAAFIGQIGKLPLPVKDTPGFLVNAVLAPYLLAAMRAVDNGLSPETVDDAMKIFGMPMGPLELADTVGLDTVHAAGEQLSDGDSVPECLRSRLARKALGRKTGHGFYTWKDGKPVRGKAPPPPPNLALELITPMVEKTREQVARCVVADADLADAGVIFGTGFAPFTGGPLHWQKNRPVSNIGG